MKELLMKMFLGKYFSKANEILQGKKTYLAGGLLILKGLLIAGQILMEQGINTTSLMVIVHSEAWKDIAEGLALCGVRSAMKKQEGTPDAVSKGE
jgi:hypothetical protein